MPFASNSTFGEKSCHKNKKNKYIAQQPFEGTIVRTGRKMSILLSGTLFFTKFAAEILV